MPLVPPHGKQRKLLPLLVSDDECAEARREAAAWPRVPMRTRETSDLIMMGIGAFTPLPGFMGAADWRSVCDDLRLADGTFWPIPITLSADRDLADRLRPGRPAALVDAETGELLGALTLEEKYSIDKRHECRQVFRTVDPNHPGVAKVLAQGEVNLSGPVRVFGESYFPARYPGLYLRPEHTRRRFHDLGWSSVAALQLRNPMHRSHEHLAKLAIEVCDGLLIHQLLGKLKPGDIPAEVRVRAVDAVVARYFVAGTCLQAGYPMEMRYAGPREALLHGLHRQNFGCSHLIVGRDHAGVGSYYGPYDAQKIFAEIPADALELRPLKFDLTFYCRRCDGMASTRTCPHADADRLLISGTALRQMLASGAAVPDHFSRPEVLEILRQYYADAGSS